MDDRLQGFRTYLKQTKRPSTVECYAQAARNFERFIRDEGWYLAGMPKDALQRWVNAMAANGAKAATVQIHSIGARRYLRWLSEQDYSVAPQGHLELPRVTQHVAIVLTPDQLHAYDAAAAQMSEPYGSALRLLGLTSLRIHEFCGLTMDDVRVSKDGILLHVREEMSKTGEGRLVPTPRAFGPILRNYLKGWRAGVTSSWLFPSPRPEKPISPSRLRVCFRSLRKRLDISGLTPHTLRRTWLTWMHQAGVDLVTIQKIAGHSSLATTSIYIKPSERVLLRAINRPMER